MSENGGHVDAQTVPVLKFKQWLDIWDGYQSVSDGNWKKPEPYIYLFSMKAGDLRNLSDVYRRKYEGDVSEGIQRGQDRSRTGRIQRYVQFGYPYGDLAAPLRNADNAHLRKPGWLPTAIVVNVLGPDDMRRGAKVQQQHLVRLVDDAEGARLEVPEINRDDDSYLAPMEVIDGQHRLWAFGDDDTAAAIPDDFQLPVVAFFSLDIPWQAYLFWSINVSPKRINKSHAFDLYPLLRTQDWLEQVGELNVYREARAQEITQLMFTFPSSAWHHRINMLGEKGGTGVSQNAWVRGLMSSFFSTGKGAGRPGLFQANVGEDEMPLPWSRGQQGAFLLAFWNELKTAIATGPRHWWIRQYKGAETRAFDDRTSLLNQDMGLRAVLSVVNDIFVAKVDDWQLSDWRLPGIEDASFEAEASVALEFISKTPFAPRIKEMAEALAGFDWRSLDGPGVKGDEKEEVLKRSFRGSGGYTALRVEVLKLIADEDNPVGRTATDILPSLT